MLRRRSIVGVMVFNPAFIRSVLGSDRSNRQVLRFLLQLPRIPRASTTNCCRRAVPKAYDQRIRKMLVRNHWLTSSEFRSIPNLVLVTATPPQRNQGELPIALRFVDSGQGNADRRGCCCRRSFVANRHATGLGAICYMWPTSDIFTIASVVKNALSTAPMLMYQHSRSGVSMPGR